MYVYTFVYDSNKKKKKYSAFEFYIAPCDNIDNGKALFAYIIHCCIKYTQVQTVFTLSTVINRALHAQSILIITHTYICLSAIIRSS